MQIAEVAIFVPLILFGVSRAGAWVLSKLGGNEEGYFITMLGIMAVAGMLSNLINLPGIVGAFLAGLGRRTNGSPSQNMPPLGLITWPAR